MNIEQFDKIFDASYIEVTSSFTKEYISEAILDYENLDSVSDEIKLFMFIYAESVKRSSELLYSVLLKVLDIDTGTAE